MMPNSMTSFVSQAQQRTVVITLIVLWEWYQKHVTQTKIRHVGLATKEKQMVQKSFQNF